MFKLHVVQADHGDCLILEYGTPSSPRYMLIDGGPGNIYQAHLKPKLLEIAGRGGQLDLVILSHVDDDHVAGLLELMGELQHQRVDGMAETIKIAALWHNTFSQTLGQDVEERFRSFTRGAIGLRVFLPIAEERSRSIKQGDTLSGLARWLDIPINPQFAPQGVVGVEGEPDPVTFGNLNLRVIGPTSVNLERLRAKWLKWLRNREKPSTFVEPTRAARAAVRNDKSTPNLSSIMVLAEAEGKTMLLTGDGRWDELLQGLAQARRLGPNGRLHVNLMKLPHHGSQRNVTTEFLAAVSADTYVICANGKDDNPDFNTLKWIVETAKQQGRTCNILVTNSTCSTCQLEKDYAPAAYRYRLATFDKEEHARTIVLVA